MANSNPVLFDIIIGVTVLLIVVMNISLFSWAKNRSKNQEKLDKTRTMIDTLRSPWKEEDQNFADLSQMVDSLPVSPVPASKSDDSSEQP